MYGALAIVGVVLLLGGEGTAWGAATPSVARATPRVALVRSSKAAPIGPRGGGGDWIRGGGGAMTSRLPVNPSGGLLSKGEPLGASALGQVVELVDQLRGAAERRQVAGARWALAHTVGRGANACVILLTR